MEKKTIKIAVVFMVICASLVLAQEDALELKYQFKAGEALKYEMTENKWTSTAMGQYPPMEVQAFINIKFSAQVNEIEEENYPVMFTFDNLDVSARVSGQTHYPDAGILRNKIMTVVISETGKIQEIMGKELLPRVQLAPSEQSGINFGDIYESLFVELPGKAVQPGDEWEISRVDTSKGTEGTMINEISGTYELSKRAKKNGYNCALIKGKITMKITQSGEAMGNKVSFEGDGKVKSQYYLAIEEGILVYSKLKIILDGDIEVSGQQKIDGIMSQNSEVTFNLIK